MLGVEDLLITEEDAQEGMQVIFVKEGEQKALLEEENAVLFSGSWLEHAFLPVDGHPTLLIGLGKKPLDIFKVKEACASAAKAWTEKGIRSVRLDASVFIQEQGIETLRDMAEGALLGTYQLPCFGEKEKEQKAKERCRIGVSGISEEYRQQAETLLEEGSVLAAGVDFARDMVNMPGNYLRPADFAEKICGFLKDLPVESVCYSRDQLKEMGMEALLAVGDGSQFPPCLLVLRYQGAPESLQTIGLIGKGVTCDTGGYCLKASASMEGIKGDMAGAGAVAGALYALARRETKANVTAVIPMCENRISSGSLLPGDVISSYAGKSIEVLNTDAEGRLILADAMSYAVRKEHVTQVLDIATLTGAVATMFGFTVGGVLCDDENWYREFERAGRTSGERYARIPFYEEHEEMIKSRLADVRNTSKGGCGTITAGLFIREFAENKPWLHLDIAGTAWVSDPAFAFQSPGATGAGVTTLYHLCTKTT